MTLLLLNVFYLQVSHLYYRNHVINACRDFVLHGQDDTVNIDVVRLVDYVNCTISYTYSCKHIKPL